jgi:hypothetical protein
MSWLDPSQYYPFDICPICQDELGTEQAIYKTSCSHIFHNNCLNTYCGMKIECPLCREDIINNCMDVWAFAEQALGHQDGRPLFDGNEHILEIYNRKDIPQQGGKRRRRRKTRKRRKSRKSRRKQSVRKRI